MNRCKELIERFESLNTKELDFSIFESKDLFSKDHIDKLRKEYSTINKVDPSLPTYKKLTDLLDKLNNDQLKQLMDADIKFISSLARNRYKK